MYRQSNRKTPTLPQKKKKQKQKEKEKAKHFDLIAIIIKYSRY